MTKPTWDDLDFCEIVIEEAVDKWFDVIVFHRVEDNTFWKILFPKNDGWGGEPITQVYPKQVMTIIYEETRTEKD